jgi:hypothetical protein
MMDIKQVREIASLVYGYWNDRLPSTETAVKQVLAPWAEMLKDIDYDIARDCVQELALSDTFMPKAAHLRILALTKQNGIIHPPNEHEAWAHVQTLSQTLANGTSAVTETHPVLLETIHQMGGMSKLDTVTNGDRTYFLAAYEKNVKNWLRKTFKP